MNLSEKDLKTTSDKSIPKVILNSDGQVVGSVMSHPKLGDQLTAKKIVITALFCIAYLSLRTSNTDIDECIFASDIFFFRNNNWCTKKTELMLATV